MVDNSSLCIDISEFICEHAAPVNCRISNSARLQHKRTKIQGHFIKGPISLAWLQQAQSLSFNALRTGLLLWYKSGLLNDKVIKTGSKLWQTFSMTRQSAYLGIAQLEKVGLVKVSRRPGCSLVVTVLDC